MVWILRRMISRSETARRCLRFCLRLQRSCRIDSIRPKNIKPVISATYSFDLTFGTGLGDPLFIKWGQYVPKWNSSREVASQSGQQTPAGATTELAQLPAVGLRMAANEHQKIETILAVVNRKRMPVRSWSPDSTTCRA